MIPKRSKLTRTTFPKHTDPRKTWNGVFLRVQYTHTRNEVNPQFAVVISKKVAPLATERNQLRRMIFDAISQQQNDFDRFKGTKFVLYVLKKEIKPTRSSIMKDISDLLLEI